MTDAAGGRLGRPDLTRIAGVEAAWFAGILIAHVLAGSSVAPKVLLFAIGLPLGWTAAYALFLRRPPASSFGPERRIGSSTFLVLLYVLYAAVPIAALLALTFFAPMLSIVAADLLSLVAGALAGLYFALFAKLLSARPRFEDEPVPGDEQRIASDKQAEKTALTLLTAGGALLALYTLAFGVYVLIEHVAAPPIRSLAG